MIKRQNTKSHFNTTVIGNIQPSQSAWRKFGQYRHLDHHDHHPDPPGLLDPHDDDQGQGEMEEAPPVFTELLELTEYRDGVREWKEVARYVTVVIIFNQV